MLIYMETTLNYFLSFHKENNNVKEKVQLLIKKGELKQLESGINYLKT